jgi:signal transduction histidine kinase
MAMQASPEMIRRIRQSLHDLSQPLAVLTGLIDLLLMEMADTDSRLKEVQLASEQLEKVLQIVTEIRHLAREASGSEAGRRGALAHPEP